MTDLISGPNTDADATRALPVAGGADPSPPRDGDQPVQWAPMEPAPKKRHLGLWIGAGTAALLAAAVAASLVLIAPGTTVAGVHVGWMTPGMASEAVSSRLAATEIELTGAGDGAVVSGADLGASVEATELAEKAFADRPMWNIGAWMGDPISAPVALDPEAATRVLQSAVPGSYTEPVDATVAFDAASGTYTTTPAQQGTGISIDELTAALTAAVEKGETSFSFPADPTPVEAAITTEEATATAEQLNSMLATIGFYVGDERTVPIAPEVAASWLSIESVDGALQVSADQAAIQAVVDTLPELVNREVVNATTIVDSAGTVLKSLSEGKDGRVLGDTSDIAADFAAQLRDGEAVFPLAVTSTPFETTALFRRVEVDLSEQRTYLYENEKLVKSWAISSGKFGSDTDLGRFKIYAQLRSQNMGREDITKPPFYYTPNVPYVSYYNADEALHGAYWHNNFGTRMSHGCVNMPVDAAKFVYEWATKGTEVWVHN